MKKLVSILIPAFNAQRWLIDALDSAINQTWPHKEIIFVDDGSTDKTLSIARKFASRQIKILSQPHAGAAAARNKALSHAQGDYIQWLDADDILAPDKIEQQMKIIEKYDDPKILYSSSWGMCFSSFKRAKFCPSPLWQNLSSVDWLINKFLTGNWMAIECWLISRELAELAGPWDENLSVDLDGNYTARIVSRSKKIVFVPEAKVYVRKINPNSICHRGPSLCGLESGLTSVEKQCQALLSIEKSHRTKEACTQALQRWLNRTFPENKIIYLKTQSLAKRLNISLTPPSFEDNHITINILKFLALTDSEISVRIYKILKRIYINTIYKICYLLRI